MNEHNDDQRQAGAHGTSGPQAGHFMASHATPPGVLRGQCREDMTHPALPTRKPHFGDQSNGLQTPQLSCGRAAESPSGSLAPGVTLLTLMRPVSGRDPEGLIKPHAREKQAPGPAGSGQGTPPSRPDLSRPRTRNSCCWAPHKDLSSLLQPPLRIWEYCGEEGRAGKAAA